MAKSVKLFVGFTHAFADNWNEWVDPPSQSNMKDETYQQKLPELWEKKKASMAKDAAPDILASRVTRVAWIEKKASVGTTEQFLEVLSQGGFENVLVGVGLHRMIRCALWSLVRAGKGIPEEYSVYWNLPAEKEIDLYKLSGVGTHGGSLPLFLRAMGYGDDQIGKFFVSSEFQAEMNLHTAVRMGLG